MTDRQLMRQIGRLFALERHSRLISQQTFAMRAGVARQQVSRFERGEHPSTTTVIARMFGALGLQLRLEVETLDADVDAMIDRVQSLRPPDNTPALPTHAGPSTHDEPPGDHPLDRDHPLGGDDPLGRDDSSILTAEEGEREPSIAAAVTATGRTRQSVGAQTVRADEPSSEDDGEEADGGEDDREEVAGKRRPPVPWWAAQGGVMDQLAAAGRRAMGIGEEEEEPAEREVDLWVGRLLSQLEIWRRVFPGAPPMLVDGALAARLLGAPIEPDRIDVAVVRDDLAALAEWILCMPGARRYCGRRRRFMVEDIDARLPGVLRWETPLATLGVRLVTVLPRAVVARWGEHRVEVCPLAEVIDAHRDVRRVLDRLRERSLH